MTGCDFSPDGSLLVTGTSVKKGQGTPQLVFVSTQTLEVVASVDVDGASVVPLLWHPKLNQIVAGNADGAPGLRWRSATARAEVVAIFDARNVMLK